MTHAHLLCIYVAAGALVAAAGSVCMAAGGLNVSARQAVTAEKGRFAAGDAVTVEFALPRAADVTIGVYADRPMGIGRRWYAHESTKVAEFRAAGKAGAQSFTFKVDQIRQPDVPLPGTPEGQERTPPKPGQPGALPGNYLIEVSNGRTFDFVCLHVRPAGGAILASRTIPGFALGAVRNRKGQTIVADRKHWRGRSFSPSWQPLRTFPQASQGHSSDPVECYDVAVDSRDNVYVMTRNGAYKFAPDGQPAAWKADAEHLKCPYPSSTKNLLGVRLERSRRRRYVFGPGGGGAGSTTYGPEDVKRPGFAFNWAGLAIDAADNVYLGRLDPKAEVQVFDSTGTYVRTVPLPKGVRPTAMRFGTDGTLWLCQDGGLVGLDPKSGGVRKKVSGVGGRLLHVGPKGAIYAFRGSRVWRLSPDGQPLPFPADAPRARQGGRYLDLDPRANKLPAGACGTTSHIASVVADADGGFCVLTKDSSHAGAAAPMRVMRFGPDGRFRVDTPAVEALPHETGNVFVGNAPAAIGLQVTNLSPEAAEVRVMATVTGLDGEARGKHDESRRVPALTSVSAPLALGVGADELGYYQIDLEVRRGSAGLASQRLYGGRVAPRGHTFAPYSAFGSVRMERNPELLRRAGGGLNRNHNPVYWNAVEPHPDEWHLQPKNALEFYRKRALPAMVILGYGEPWLDGGFARCRITRYDTFFDYVATVVRRHKGTPEMWQFWNEPNFFWHVPGRFRYEHYVMVLKATYAIAKAIDPDTPVICDGFAGSAKEMANFGKWSAGRYTDAVPIHYPGTKPVRFDEMPLKGTYESKAEMIRQLAAIRDEHFPGRELLNTEEGVWGVADRTPRTGAEALGRIYVSQIAAGLDRLTWFETFSATDPGYLLRGVQAGPWPAYFAYATASRFLENAQYVGALSDGLAQVHVFADRARPVLVAWSVEGRRDYVLKAPGRKLTVTDWQGKPTKTAGGGKLTLTLGPTVQFVTGMDAEVFRPLVAKRLAAVRENKEIAPALDALRDGTKEAIGLNALFHAARASEVAALVEGAGGANAVAAATAAVEKAATALKEAETGGAYLRDARTALAIARRTAYFMDLAREDNAAYAARLAPCVKSLARQVRLRVASETPWYPGLMLRVGLDTTAIRAEVEPKIKAALDELAARRKRQADLAKLTAEAKTDPAKAEQLKKLRAQVNADRGRRIHPPPLDEKFPPQVTKKPGEQVEIEMTVYNWTAGELRGELRPVLPGGWKAVKEAFAYRVAPMKFARFVTTATVPADARPGVYAIGARTRHRNVEQRELHAHRVLVRR